MSLGRGSRTERTRAACACESEEGPEGLLFLEWRTGGSVLRRGGGGRTQGTHTESHRPGRGPWNLSEMRLSRVAGADETENEQEGKGMGGWYWAQGRG